MSDVKWILDESSPVNVIREVLREIGYYWHAHNTFRLRAVAPNFTSHLIVSITLPGRCYFIQEAQLLQRGRACFVSLNISPSHSRLFEMTPLSRVKSLLMSRCNFGSILYHFRHKAKCWSKIVIFFIYPCIRRPRWGSRSEYCHNIWCEKTNGVDTQRWKKCDDTFSRFVTIPVCDRQTDRQTDKLTTCDSIVRAMHRHRTVKRS